MDGYSIGLRVLKPERPAVNPALLLSFTEMDCKDYLSEGNNGIPARLFAENGHYVMTFDAPYHGSRNRAGADNMADLRDAILRGEPVFEIFINETENALRYFNDITNKRGYRYSGKTVICGTSRFGNFAARAFARNEGISALAMFAPVCEFGALSEFACCKDDASVGAYDLMNLVDGLAGRPVSISIGHMDERVDSLRSIELYAALSRRNRERGYPDEKTQFFCTDDIGHGLDEKWYQIQTRFLLGFV